VSELLNVTRERIRQIETQALSKLGSVADTRTLRDFHDR
jgi:DNA-directed RNA polymerase sigma subunit (sigma70/sigma32)